MYGYIYGYIYGLEKIQIRALFTQYKPPKSVSFRKKILARKFTGISRVSLEVVEQIMDQKIVYTKESQLPQITKHRKKNQPKSM